MSVKLFRRQCIHSDFSFSCFFENVLEAIPPYLVFLVCFVTDAALFLIFGELVFSLFVDVIDAVLLILWSFQSIHVHFFSTIFLFSNVMIDAVLTVAKGKLMADKLLASGGMTKDKSVC